MHPRGFINGIHYCFIVDEIGMASVFPQIKLRLSEHTKHHVSLIYFSANNLFAFKKELTLLEKIFCLQFMVSYESTDSSISVSQEVIEAILNANVMGKMGFIISGVERFIMEVKTTLHFLGVENIEIKERLFS